MHEQPQQLPAEDSLAPAGASRQPILLPGIAPGSHQGAALEDDHFPGTPARKAGSADAASSAAKSLESWQILRQRPLPPPRSEDNYELSDQDADDSDMDEAREAARRAEKPIPRWCDDYLETLRRQGDMDPDTVFGGRVPQCSLDLVFPDELYKKIGKSRPKRARGSSGDWRRDRLTPQEIVHYKRKMGQTKGWMADAEK